MAHLSRPSVERSCSSITRSIIKPTSLTITRLWSSSMRLSRKVTLQPSLSCKAPSNSMAEEGGGEPPKGSLGWAIDTHFGSVESLVHKINAEGAALQGSGWVWLGVDKELKKLVIETTANQDPLVTKGPNLVPLFGIDVWEHAYYLQYKNVRPDYLKNIWKVINWTYASHTYEKECP